MIIDSLDYTPYLLGYNAIARPMMDRLPAALGARFYDIFDPSCLDFYRLVNAGNCAAFGDLGMPLWVQLDCCTLPSAMIGFTLPRAQIAPDLWRRLTHHAERIFGPEAAARLDDYDGPVPVSEYCGVRAHDPDVTLGFSMFALVPAARLGVRTKALALLAYGTPRQIGTTQWNNTAVRAHCRFGPLHILEPRARTHSRPEATFVYAIDVPAPDALLDLIASGDSPRIRHPAPAFTVEAASPADAADQIERLIRERGPLALTAPGLLSTEPLRVQVAPSGPPPAA